MVAAFRNLQIAVVPWCELEAGFGNQVDKGVGDRRGGFMHRLDDRFILMRPLLPNGI